MWLLLIISFIILLFLSRKLTSSLYLLTFLIFKSNRFALAVLAGILLPGTVIHELSHFFIATILRVPTGNLTVFPKVERSGEVRTGRLEMAGTDPFRHTLIGLAPLITGVLIIYVIGKIFLNDFFLIPNSKFQIPDSLIGSYLLFITTNTMFTSKRDLAGLKIAGPIILITLISLYYLGIRIFLEEPVIRKIDTVLKNLNSYLVLAAIINFLVYLFLILNIKFWQKILKRNVIKVK